MRPMMQNAVLLDMTFLPGIVGQTPLLVVRPVL
jgi:hypothetical protein